ncbi:MAG: hypothetical protein A2Z12_04820 [Actinobacteria bacterium RBG_16_68_21]|nr:MAG: hypothetical protein A2Z12_04820 [Actinobacteria bacterium RBG_16_68_21]
MADAVGSPQTGIPWWHGAVGYEIYIRSFADSDGDGIGDLVGARARLAHLAWLGVDAVWVTPFFPSPGFDHGYDVSDYRDVDPRHGTLSDFDAFSATAHDLGLKVVVDIVPNHTSHLHRWFAEARKSRDSAFRDYYLWHDPAPTGGPPNNWVSHFGGPAWTLDEASGQYYCHLFLPQQPDLNWRNEDVRAEFDEILRFWLDRGVDGFRIDVAHGLLKDPLFRDNPRIRVADSAADNWGVFFSFEHCYDLDQDDTVDIYRRWHRLVEPYGAALIGEVALDDPVRMARYIGGGALDSAFFLQPPWMGWEPAALLDAIRGMHDREPNRVSWAIDNHDHSRSVTRFGGGARGARRSLAVTTLISCLGGIPFLYQGQELGIGDGTIAPDDLADPIATRNEGALGRDGARTPMPWEPGPGNGFTAGTPWLRADDRPHAETVAGQMSIPDAPIHQYRALLGTRRAHPELGAGPAAWLDTGSAEMAVIRRGSMLVVANLSADYATITTGSPPISPVFSSAKDPMPTAAGSVRVPPETTVVFATPHRADTQEGPAHLVDTETRV